MTTKLNSVRFIWWHSAFPHSHWPSCFCESGLADSGERRPVCSLSCILWPQKPGEAMSNGNCNESWLPQPSEAERKEGGMCLMVKKEAMKERLHDSGGDHVTRRTEPSAEMCYWGFFFPFIYLSCTYCTFIHFLRDVKQSSFLGFECLMTPLCRSIFI